MSVASIQELFASLINKTAKGNGLTSKNYTKYHTPKAKTKMRRKMARASRKANRK